MGFAGRLIFIVWWGTISLLIEPTEHNLKTCCIED